MPVPIPQYLRLKVVESYKNKEGSMRILAKRFDVSRDFIFRMVKLSKTDPELIGKQNNPRGQQPKIKDENLEFIMDLIKDKADLTLEELCNKYNDEYKNSDVANTAMLNALRRLELTRKKKAIMILENIQKIIK